MKQLRVLHVVGGYPTIEKPFHQIFIKTQVDSLLELGIHCEVLHLQGAGFRKYLTGRPQVHKSLKQGQFDLIHAHYTYCGVVSLGNGVPVITSFLGSDLYGVPREDGSYPFLNRLFHNKLSRFVANRSNGSIVKSQRMKNDLGYDVHVVPNGVDLSCFKPATEEERYDLRRGLGLDPDTYYVIFAGNPKLSVKRYPLALKSFQETQERVSCPIELLVLTGRPHEEVIRYMRACDMLMLTSSHEGSPNVVKEAMGAGLAVLAVDVGDTKERLFGVSGCRVSDDDSPSAIANAMVDLVNSTEPREGPKAVASLAMDLVAQRIRGIYQDLL